MANMQEVARYAGVSLGTVSNVLNRPEVVAEETRKRVQRAIKDLKFVRNGSARQLRAGTTQSIGLVVLDITNPFFTEVARGAEDAASEQGYIVTLGNSDSSPAKEDHYLRAFAEQRIAGILITPVNQNLDDLRAFQQRGTAVVLLDRPYSGTEICSTSVNDEHGGYLAGIYLLALGHQRIGYLHGSLAIRHFADRLAGLRRAVTEAGHDPDAVITLLAATADNPHAGKACADQVLHTRPQLSAVFCGSDYLAMGLIHGLNLQHVRVPDDISIIGYDDIDMAAMLAVPLTTIRQPKYELGYGAVRLLLDEIAEKGEHHHQQAVFLPELMVRASTR